MGASVTILSKTEQIDDGQDGLVVTGCHHVNVMAVRPSGDLFIPLERSPVSLEIFRQLD